MGSTVYKFDAVVLAAVSGVLGIAYLVTSMIGMMPNGRSGVLLLLDSVPITAVVGLVLLLTAGGFVAGQRLTRYLGLIAFGALVPLGYPAVLAVDPVQTFATAVGIVAVLYLSVRNPVVNHERSGPDDSTSGTRVGSTLR